jgi:DNA-binding MarR family transcriptional regulator
MSADQTQLDRLDAALMRLRRLWTGPRAAGARPAGDPAGGVELSTVLVVDAVVREGGGATVGHVAGQLDVAPSTASRLVERAVAAGMLARSTDPADSRRTVLRATAEGLALHAQAGAFRTRYLAQVLAGWTPQEAQEFVDGLDRFAAAVARTGPPSGPEVNRRGTAS